MRILYLSTWYPYPPDIGAKLRDYYLLRAVAGAHTVTLVSFAFGTARPEQPGNLHELCAAIHVVPIDPFAANRAGALRTFLSSEPVACRPIPAMSRLVAEVCRSNTFDIVVASTELMACYALAIPYNVVRILLEHNSMSRWMHDRYLDQTKPLQSLRCWASWQKMRRYESWLFGHFDLVTMVSELDRASSLALPGYHGPVEVVANGVDCRHNKLGLVAKCPDRLVYNGSLTYSPNYEAMRWFLADIYPLIRQQASGVSLAITGSTQGVDLHSLCLDDSVWLTGHVDDVRLPVAEAAVCVVPLREGGGTRLKILEAMALETPVVATPKGAEGLDVVDGVHLLVASTPEEIARATIRLLHDPGLGARLSANARRLVEQIYDWEKLGDQFLRFAERIALQGRPPRARTWRNLS